MGNYPGGSTTFPGFLRCFSYFSQLVRKALTHAVCVRSAETAFIPGAWLYLLLKPGMECFASFAGPRLWEPFELHRSGVAARGHSASRLGEPSNWGRSLAD